MVNRQSHPRIFSAGMGVTLAALLTAALAVLPAAAQEPLPGIFGEVIDVRVVNIEVVVTDRDGNRVAGLGPEDFRLLVDGEVVPIDYFTEVLGGVAVEPEAEAPAAVPQGLPSVAAGKPVGTSYLVFVDDFFSIERDRNRVIDLLREQLPFLNPEDRMAIVAFDGRRLTMLSSWSQSQPELDRALREAGLRPAHGLQRVSEYRRVATTRGLGAFEEISPFPEIGYRLTPDERQYVSRLTDQIQRLISGASATLRSFAMPPGRKVMLLLAGGWPFDPAQLAAANRELPVLDLEFERGYELFEPLVNTANLLGYTIYPVDVPGLVANAADASVGGTNVATPIGGIGSVPSGSNVAAAPEVGSGTFLDEQEMHTSLYFIAEGTGGEALLNARRGNALAAAASDTRSYYWLGFTPKRQRDDEAHRIEVEVEGRGLRVRAREGFLDFSREAEVSAMVESTLLFGNAPSAGGLPLQVGEVKKAGRNRMEVPLTLAIPVDAITVLPVEGRYVAELELRIAVLDEEGNQAEIPVIPLTLEGDQEPSSGSFIRYDTTVKLRQQKHELVVALYDPASGRIVSNRAEVAPAR